MRKLLEITTTKKNSGQIGIENSQFDFIMLQIYKRRLEQQTNYTHLAIVLYPCRQGLHRYPGLKLGWNISSLKCLCAAKVSSLLC